MLDGEVGILLEGDVIDGLCCKDFYNRGVGHPLVLLQCVVTLAFAEFIHAQQVGFLALFEEVGTGGGDDHAGGCAFGNLDESGIPAALDDEVGDGEVVVEALLNLVQILSLCGIEK